MTALSLTGSVYDDLDKADTLISKGEYKESLSLLDGVISSPKLRNSILFESLDKRARCHKLLGNYALSMSDYDRALAIPASDLNLAIVMLNKCDLMIQIGMYDEAEKLLKSIGDINDSIMNRRQTNLASVYVRTGNFSEAEKIYHGLINTLADTEKATALQNLGFLYLTQGNWGMAVDALSNSLQYFTDASKEWYIAMSNLAFSQAFAGLNSEALSNIDRAIAGLTGILGSKHPDVAIALRKRAEIYLKSGNIKGAESDFKNYFETNKSEIKRVFADLTTQSRLDYWKKEKPLISLAFGLEGNTPALLLDIALFRRAMAMSGANTDIRVFSINGGDVKNALRPGEIAMDFTVYPKRDAYGKLEDHIGALVVKQTSVSFVGLGKAADIENHKIRNLNLKDAISSGNPDCLNMIYSDSVLSKKIWQPLLPSLKSAKKIYFAPDGIFNLLAIEYLQDVQDKFVFNRLTNLGNLASRKDRTSVKAASSPFLLVGGLDYDKMPELPESEGGNNDAKNHYAADYLENAVNGFAFNALPGMKEEVDRIHKLIPVSEMTDEMSEERFKLQTGRYRRLHVSTHGYTLHVEEPEQPFLLTDSVAADMSLWASGLVLSGANVAKNFKGVDDGLLSAREICDMDMSHVDFVALSACQTADGKVCDEGPAGLVRGLKNAGAKTIVATLWEVNDDAALRFMTKFYELQNSGISAQSAFAQARNFVREFMVEEPELIAEFDPAIQSTRVVETGEVVRTYPMSDPYFWAPFIIIDNIE